MFPGSGPAIQTFQTRGLTRGGAEALVEGNLPSDPLDKLQVGNAIHTAVNPTKGVLGIASGEGQKIVDWSAKSFGKGGSAAGFVARAEDRRARGALGDVGQAGLAALQRGGQRVAGSAPLVARGPLSLGLQSSGARAGGGIVALGARGPYTIGGTANMPTQPGPSAALAILGKVF